MRRISGLLVLCLTASVAELVVAAPAHAAAQSRVWMDGASFHYQYGATAPAVNLSVRTSGSILVVQDDYGLYLPPASGCWYPTQNATLVHCAGIESYGMAWIDTGPLNDRVDFYPTGIYTAMETVVKLNGGDDVFLGGDGPDTVEGGDGNDTLHGYGSLDKFWPGPGADQVSGGSGPDEVHYDYSPAGVTADLDGALYDDGVPGEKDSLAADIEALIGSAFDDVLTGNTLDNSLYGRGGSDRLYGLASNDLLVGDDDSSSAPRGADVMVGGPGFDTVNYRYRPAGITVNLTSTRPATASTARRTTSARTSKASWAGSPTTSSSAAAWPTRSTATSATTRSTARTATTPSSATWAMTTSRAATAVTLSTAPAEWMPATRDLAA